MTPAFLKRSFWQRIFGIPATRKAENGKGWHYDEGRLFIDLGKTKGLSRPGTSLRFEGHGLPKPVLVVHAEDGRFHAFHNRCTHIGHRRLDHVPGTQTIQCCSVNKSTYTFAGEKIHGPNPKPVETFTVEKQGNTLVVNPT